MSPQDGRARLLRHRALVLRNMMRRFVLFADRPPSELRERAVRLRHVALTAMTPKGMRALIDLANKYEAAAAERDGAGAGSGSPTARPSRGRRR